MPVDPLSLALMAVNVGASVFNNWRNNKQSQKLQEKQQEFARAAAERNKQRMWQLMREGQELALEMEHENHENRLADIRNDFDKILHRLAYAQAINSWPLKVLPIVMRNQSLGSLTAMANENIAMHCILTPSNCTAFNKHILPVIEDRLADFCNLHWSNLSSHPLLFYSGAWKTGKNPTGVEIAQLKTNLNNLPTLLITPFFKPEGGIIFQLNVWGIGVELESEIECTDFSYADSYKCGIDYQSDEDIKERTIEEFVPYLQCLIGYIADQYFWTNYNEPPLLPTLLVMNVVNTDGMRYLNITSEERYSNLLDVCEKESLAMPFAPDKMLPLLEGSAVMWDDKRRKEKLEQIFIAYVNKISGKPIISMSEAIESDAFTKSDKPFLIKFISLYQYNDYKAKLGELIEVLNTIDFDYTILDSTDIPYLEVLANNGNGVAMYRLGEIYEYSIGTDFNPNECEKYYKESENIGFPLASIRHKLLKQINITKSDYQYLQNSETPQFIIFRSYCLHKGYGINQSTEDAMEELEKLSESKHPYAYYIAAQIVKDTYGKEQGELFVELLLKSANLGYVQAQVDLMNIYYEGEYVQENSQLSVEYAQKAALQAHPEALFTLAIYLIRGYGTKCNKAKAREFLSLAAERGNNDAIEILKSISK